MGRGHRSPRPLRLPTARATEALGTGGDREESDRPTGEGGTGRGRHGALLWVKPSRANRPPLQPPGRLPDPPCRLASPAGGLPGPQADTRVMGPLLLQGALPRAASKRREGAPPTPPHRPLPRSRSGCDRAQRSRTRRPTHVPHAWGAGCQRAGGGATGHRVQGCTAWLPAAPTRHVARPHLGRGGGRLPSPSGGRSRTLRLRCNAPGYTRDAPLCQNFRVRLRESEHTRLLYICTGKAADQQLNPRDTRKWAGKETYSLVTQLSHWKYINLLPN